MAVRAFRKHPLVPLELNARHVVVGKGTWKLSMCGTVARGAVKTAVTARETEQRKTLARRVRIRRKAFIHSHAIEPVGKGRGVADQAVVAHRIAAVASLTGRLVEPPGSTGVADRAERAVTALTLHRQLAIRSYGGSHNAAQTARFRAGMATIAGGAVAAGVER